MLEIEKITKTFLKGTPNEHTALRGLSLTLDDGDFVTVIGSNGAGKSTLFNAIAGSFLCDSGRILLDGKDITYQKEHKRAKQIGRIFQDPMKGTAPDLTVEENMALAYSKSTRNILASAHRKKILRFSAKCSRNSTWGWKTVCAPKWGSFPAGSARRSRF